MTLIRKAPAKINLFLHVLRKRPDGYHDIQTLFERISLFDEIRLKQAPSGIQVRSDSRTLGDPKDNLVYRAAVLLKDLYGVRAGVHITLKKNIPIAAGLGGGSSDAASTLLGLNRLWRLGLSQKTLLTIGARIGSDVPFFILQTSFALGTGRGEVLRTLPIKTKLWHCIVRPDFEISTREAYQALPVSLLTLPSPDVKMLVRSLKLKDPKGLSQHLTNSLELALNKRLTRIIKVKKKLASAGALGCLLSGSGSCVFGIFESKGRAEAAAKLLKRNKRWKVFVASTF